MGKTLENQSTLRGFIDRFGMPRLIIAAFVVLLFVMAPIVGADLTMQIGNVINRFSWNAVLVLAMVPMIQSGCSLNFGIPLGILSGLLGGTLSIQLGFTGVASFFVAILLATPFAVLVGGGYGWLLNKIKGGEMMIATYVGLASIAFMCMMWLLLPYTSPTMVWGLSGKGLRTTISLDGFYGGALANFLQIPIDPMNASDWSSDVCSSDLRHRHDRRGLQPPVCPGLRHQCGQDAPAVGDHVHLAGRGGHPGLSAGLRLHAAVHGPQ